MTEFMTEQKFLQEIKNSMKEHNTNHIEAILHFCNEHEIDVEDIKQFVGKSLKNLIRHDAENEGLMVTRTSKLPL